MNFRNSNGERTLACHQAHRPTLRPRTAIGLVDVGRGISCSSLGWHIERRVGDFDHLDHVQRRTATAPGPALGTFDDTIDALSQRDYAVGSLTAMTDGRAANTVEVAALYGVHRAEVSGILPLAFLAPGITEAILNGRQPVELSARKLSRQIDLPVAWAEQTSLFEL